MSKHSVVKIPGMDLDSFQREEGTKGVPLGSETRFDDGNTVMDLKKYTGNDNVTVRDLFHQPKTDVCFHLSYTLPNPKKKQTETYCAMTGPFKDKYAKFREYYLGKTRHFNWVHYRHNLLVGHSPGVHGGWLFHQSKIEEMKSALTSKGIKFNTSTFDQNIRTKRLRGQKKENMRRYRAKKRAQKSPIGEIRKDNTKQL